MFETHVVPSFGGGLRFDSHPAFIPDDCWSWADGWLPRNGTAEILPAYEAIVSNLTLAASRYLLDLVPHPTAETKLLLVIGNSAAPPAAPYFYSVDAFAANTYDTITWDTTGTAPTSSLDSLDGVGASAAQIGGTIVVTWGTPTGGTYALGRWDGAAATYVPINPTAACMAQMLTTFNNRLVAIRRSQTLVRDVAWSESNSATVWDAAISNSADDVTLDDMGFKIVASGRRSDGTLALLSAGGQALLSPTGGIPAFTERFVGVQGCRSSPRNACAETPYGLCWAGYDDIYIEGKSIGTPIFRYYASQTTITTPEMPSFVWHPGLRSIVMPLQTMTTGTRAMLLGDPVTGAWTRRTVARPGADYYGFFRQAVATGTTIPRHCLVTIDTSRNVRLYGESTAGTPQSGAFVDTKDFAFSSPLHSDYTDRIKIDVEPLTTAATDAVIVQAAVHNDLSRQGATGILGVDGMQTSGLTFTTVGTATAGASELPVRLKGKYIRFRFLQSSGRARVRGFSIRRQRASDRKL